MDGKSFVDNVGPSFYGELKRIADRLMHGERQVTFSATSLVGDALLECSRAKSVPDDPKEQRRFFARIMYNNIVDGARRRQHAKRADVRADEVPDPTDFAAIVEVDDMVASMARSQPELGEIVHMALMQLTPEETGEALGCSARTIRRRLKDAAAFFRGRRLFVSEIESSEAS
jgi:DNA-directed RNA polymerase specialized sigma24 family protein